MPPLFSDPDDSETGGVPSGVDKIFHDESDLMLSTDNLGSEVSDDDGHETSFGSDDLDELQIEVPDPVVRPLKRRRLDYIRSTEFIYPLSRYEGYKPPLPLSKESYVVAEFTEALFQQGQATVDDEGDQMRMPPGGSAASNDEGYIEFELIEFSVYLPGSVARLRFEMQGLQNLATKYANSWYCFDGILISGKLRRYVQCVPFKLCSIGNYGQEHHGVGDNIWIQSVHNEGTDVYYRLKAPSSAYERYHEGFVWLANLAKHFVDYSKIISDRNQKISIRSFRSDFADWLHKVHGESANFQAWFQQFNCRDFSGQIAGNIDFLWKEAIGTWPALSEHPVWKETMTLDAIPLQRVKGDGTVVTPYVYDCFSHLPFGSHLKKVDLRGDVDTRRKSQGRALNLTTVGTDSGSSKPKKLNREKISPETSRKSSNGFMSHSLGRESDPKSIAVGDVLGVTKDGFDSKWKNEQSGWETADDCWYVYVQSITESKQSRTFDVIWLYKPSHTSCAVMKYPHQDELFLSDNCWHDMPEDEVIRKVSVSWGCLPAESKSDFFIRQTYLTQDNSFVTVAESHKKCAHWQDAFKTPLQDVVDRYRIGDTVLIEPSAELKSRHGLEPAEIVEFVQKGHDGLVVMRRLFRRRDVDGNTRSRPNELVYSDQIFTISAKNVKRKCLVRFYSSSDLEDRMIPTPYDRDGTGDAFYILTRLVKDDTAGGSAKILRPIQRHLPSSLIQGFDPCSKPARDRLRGLDLYCGGGNFGRGLEEGGAVHNTHAVDLNKNAIHSYNTNLKDSETTKLYYGSVDDMLEQALLGNPSGSELIPLPGEIDFISAGSPCQGFSLLNSKRGNEKGLKNQSLVASVAAYVDVYRPKYALLENVISMAQKGKRRTEDVLSQLICCLVGMGYQVQLFNLDAWSFGSPQTRSRIFVSIVAPGLELPSHPELSHSHPMNTTDRGLGKMANNQDFGQRRFGATPFEFVTAGEVTEDLPDIGDGRTYQCIKHPDHRMSVGVPRLLKSQIEVIPTNPLGLSFRKAWEQGRLTNAERSLFPHLARSGQERQSVGKGSRAWARVHPHKLFPIIATSNRPACSRSGRTLHWNQQRMITILEARRAQSFPDHEVLIGSASDQWRIVGNSVARSVALALGLSLREAWLKNAHDEARDVPYQAKPRVQTRVKEMSLSEQDSSDEGTSDKQYRKSLDAMGLTSSVSASQGEGESSSGITTEPTTPRERKQKLSINTPCMGRISTARPSEKVSRTQNLACCEVSTADEESGFEEITSTRKVKRHPSIRGSRRADSPRMSVMRRLQTQHEASQVLSKPGKSSSASKPPAPRANGPNTRPAAPLYTDRKPVVLVTPAKMGTAAQVFIISDDEDEPTNDDDKGMFVPYELTQTPSRRGGAFGNNR